MFRTQSCLEKQLYEDFLGDICRLMLFHFHSNLNFASQKREEIGMACQPNLLLYG